MNLEGEFSFYCKLEGSAQSYEHKCRMSKLLMFTGVLLFNHRTHTNKRPSLFCDTVPVSELRYEWRFTVIQFVLATSP
jgi:hypothetical protein